MDLTDIPDHIREALLSGQPVNGELLLNLPPEIQLIIVQQLAPAEILRLCETSKEFNRIFCSQDIYQLWEHLYRRDISKVYLPVAPETYRSKYQRIMNSLKKVEREKGLEIAIDEGAELLLEHLLSSGPNSLETLNEFLVEHPTRRNQVNIVDILVKHGATQLNNAMRRAAQNRAIGVVNELAKLGANNFNDVALIAANRGNLPLLERLIELGANNFADIFDMAAQNDSTAILNMMLNRKLIDSNVALPLATDANQYEIVRRLIDEGAPNGHPQDFNKALNEALKYAARNGNMDMVKLLVKSGAIDFGPAIVYAKQSAHVEILRYLTALQNNKVN